MPIHDQGYRRYAGHREAHGRTWMVIARAGVMERLRERKFLGLLLVAWLPFLVRSVQLYVAANYAQASFLNATPAMFNCTERTRNGSQATSSRPRNLRSRRR